MVAESKLLSDPGYIWGFTDGSDQSMRERKINDDSKTKSAQFSCSVMSDSLRPHEWQMPGLPVHYQLPDFTQIHVHWVGDANLTISASVVPFSSCLQSFPTSGSFLMSQLLASDGQSIGASASASVLPMIIQGWFPLEWTGLISLQFKELSRVFSNTTQFKSINSSALSFLYNPDLTSIHDYWKNHSFDYTDLCQQSNISTF